jgi:hypothetical protein
MCSTARTALPWCSDAPLYCDCGDSGGYPPLHGLSYFVQLPQPAVTFANCI